ncbi:hypothetical protein AML91_09975 [Paenibacillus jilunlii]|uniref:Uncharacterized protein n=1 Tax=Paenibacillus jilunlii TaxID=682956 RepID=A0ABR5SWD4_9BACL|nr:hypothetical protein AML91_09975 [Paenibacillus jilunlii]
MAEEKFGTVGALAFAFVSGFYPLKEVRMKKSGYGSGRKSKHSLESQPVLNTKIKSSVYIVHGKEAGGLPLLYEISGAHRKIIPLEVR